MSEENLDPAPHVTDELSAHLYGELSTERADAVDAHLAACADCRGEWEDLRRMHDILSAWREPDEDRAVSAEEARHVAASVVHHVHESRLRKKHRRRLTLVTLMAAAALLFLVTGMRVSHEPGHVTLSFALPGAGEREDPLEDLVRRVAVEELALRIRELEENQDNRLREWMLQHEEEAGALFDALAQHRIEDRRYLDDTLASFDREALEQHHRTREALFDLASAVAMKP